MAKRSDGELIAAMKPADDARMDPVLAAYTRDRVLVEVLLDCRSLLQELVDKFDKKGK